MGLLRRHQDILHTKGNFLDKIIDKDNYNKIIKPVSHFQYCKPYQSFVSLNN